MDFIVQKDNFCTRCSLQFGNKVLYEMHLSLLHKEAKNKEKVENFKIDRENVDHKCISPSTESADFLKDSISKPITLLKKKQNICSFCEMTFTKKWILKKHIKFVHEEGKGKKMFILCTIIPDKG